MEFDLFTAFLIFITYTCIDILYARYIICVNNKRPFNAAILTAIIYSLLAFGVVSYSKNIFYLIPLASGAFLGTYITVKYFNK